MSLRALAVVLSTLAASVALAAPATAETQVLRDARGDVRDVDGRGARQGADILRVRAEHEDGAVTATYRVADLDAADTTYAGIRLRTPTGSEFNAVAYREDGRKVVQLARGFGDERVRCPGLRGRFFPATDRIEISVPRRCVERPRWVRFGAVLGAGGRRTFFADDARLDGRVDDDGLPSLGRRRLAAG